MPSPQATIAADVRRKIKLNRDALGIPATAKIRVTSQDHASVLVEISGADDWAWTADKTLSAEVQRVGKALAALIVISRCTVDATYVWGTIRYDTASVGSAPREGWEAGQD